MQGHGHGGRDGSDGCAQPAKLERYYAQMLRYVPWALLVPATLFSQASGQSVRERAVTLGLVALAAGWVLAGHTLAPQRRRQRPGPVYFAGLLVLFAALMQRDVIFVLFAITGFFHAYPLRPWQIGVAGVFGTSVVLNTMTMRPFDADATAGDIGVYVGVVLVQSATIGAGVLFAEKSGEHDRRREEMVARLEAALEENAGLHAQLLTQAREAGVLDERQRMAREIHDTLAQGLAGIITQVQAAQRVWHASEQARPHLDRALGLARESLAEARRSVQALRPSDLDEAHLPDALAGLIRRWADGAGVDVRLDVTGDRVPLSPGIEVALFRVTQEALTNVARHAGASRVGVTLSYLGEVVLLDVRDDGCGMVAGDTGGFGLNSMRQRIRGLGGSMAIESGPGEGTALSVSVPMIPVGVRSPAQRSPAVAGDERTVAAS